MDCELPNRTKGGVGTYMTRETPPEKGGEMRKEWLVPEKNRSGEIIKKKGRSMKIRKEQEGEVLAQGISGIANPSQGRGFGHRPGIERENIGRSTRLKTKFSNEGETGEQT